MKENEKEHEKEKEKTESKYFIPSYNPLIFQNNSIFKNEYFYSSKEIEEEKIFQQKFNQENSEKSSSLFFSSEFKDFFNSPRNTPSESISYLSSPTYFLPYELIDYDNEIKNLIQRPIGINLNSSVTTKKTIEIFTNHFPFFIKQKDIFQYFVSFKVKNIIIMIINIFISQKLKIKNKNLNY